MIELAVTGAKGQLERVSAILDRPTRKLGQGNQHSPRVKVYLQSIPEKGLQGFCFQDSHIALSTHFSWQVEYGRHECGNLVILFYEIDCTGFSSQGRAKLRAQEREWSHA